MKIGVLLLAAGHSSRFGADKRLARLSNGTQVLAASIAQALASGLPLLVCIGSADVVADSVAGTSPSRFTGSTADDLVFTAQHNTSGPPGTATLADFIERRGARWLICPRAAQGMGFSIADACAQLPDWDGVLLALADMPAVAPATFLEVAAALTPEAMVQPVYRGRPGHPVGFGQRFFADMRALTGDTGARKLLRQNPGSVIQLAVTDDGVLRDIDTRADLAGFQLPKTTE